MKRLLATTAIALVGTFAAPLIANAGQQAPICANTWNAVDTNMDGRISPQEARAASGVDFAKLDTNHDGHVSVTEWVDCNASRTFHTWKQVDAYLKQHPNLPNFVKPARLELTGASGSKDLLLSPASSEEREHLRFTPVAIAKVPSQVIEEWRDMRRWVGEG